MRSARGLLPALIPVAPVGRKAVQQGRARRSESNRRWAGCGACALPCLGYPRAAKRRAAAARGSGVDGPAARSTTPQWSTLPSYKPVRHHVEARDSNVGDRPFERKTVCKLFSLAFYVIQAIWKIGGKIYCLTGWISKGGARSPSGTGGLPSVLALTIREDP